MNAYADQEARLRRALHAAADSLEPRGDGLERIRARLQQPRPMSLAWARAACASIIMRAPAWLQDAVYQVADWLRLVWERFAPAQAPGRHRSRAQGLLRPLAAMAVVMFIVAAGTYVAIDASTAIFPSSSSTSPSGGGSNGHGHSGAAGPGASHGSGSGVVNGTGSHARTPAPAKSCKSPAPAGTTTTPAQQQTTSPDANPTPTDSSTSSDTSSATPSDTTSASPASTDTTTSLPSPVTVPTSTPDTTPALAAPSPSC